ncbi:MAG: hypothetical protein UY17_C0009G0003 [Candidatus Beckwithbacteria bacterium GW2011_GWC2_47_9]|uniref:Uncharacterized protein n=1 Tax=Candidatus Beckwithbacteria bacterium GW2011_GWC2_47_9 TaxID=1618373 RepID=A0A0G1U154_9BACT|nr:MAG: hypothetical protein UY17_C0009G0003 [Candidatus Beckwithbacteria bacterium GW2011_GWC2_47_9]
MMFWLFIFGLAVDIFLSGRLGQTSLILLLAAAALSWLNKQIKLK